MGITSPGSTAGPVKSSCDPSRREQFSQPQSRLLSVCFRGSSLPALPFQTPLHSLEKIVTWPTALSQLDPRVTMSEFAGALVPELVT
jgi:hypothetical protein